MIDHNTVERIMELANGQIVDVVSDFVELRRRGVNYLGRCPFHDEKTPSFTVSPSKGIFKCFGCGKGGNAVNFVMEHEQFTFVEAIKYLGEKFHIHIEEEEETPEMREKKNERESMLLVTQFAANFFIDNLLNTDEGKSVGLSYLRQRQIRDDMIARFQLGYSPQKKDALIQEAKKKGYKETFLEKTGLITVKENFKGDRFRGRIMFPIHSLAGKVIGFGGRIMVTDPEKKYAKYQNSPESEIYHKSKVLYGIFQAKQEISKQDKCFLVEGYTDVISFHQSGISNVVASSGTALTVDQVKLISRFTKNVTVIYDGDPAGIKASLRGIDIILAEGLNVKVLLLPEGEDPDSYSKKLSSEDLKKYILDNETDFIKFKTKLLLDDAQGDPVKKATLIQDIVRSIAVIPEPITQSVYVKECSRMMDISEQILLKEINNIKNKRLHDAEQKARRERMLRSKDSATQQNIPQQKNTKNPLNYDERVVLRYLMLYGEIVLYKEEPEDEDGEETPVTVGEYIISELKKDNITSDNHLHNLVLELYEKAEKGEGFTALKFFVNNSNVEISELASDIIGKEYELSKIHARFGGVPQEIELLIEHVPKVVTELRLKKTKLTIQELRLKLKKVQEEGRHEELVPIMEEIRKWDRIKSHISKELGGRTIV